MKAQRLTKLQKEYLERGIPNGSYVAYPEAIFKHKNYAKWKRERRAKLRNAPASINKMK